MMTYTYRCEKCNHEFEAQQRISDDPLQECPECKELALKKIIKSSGGGFRIWGRGVYKPTTRLGN